MTEDKDIARWLTLQGKIEATCAVWSRSKRQTKRYMWHFWQAMKANDFEAAERLKDKIEDDSLVFGEGKPTEPRKDFHPMFDLIVDNLLKKKIAEEEANENAD